MRHPFQSARRGVGATLLVASGLLLNSAGALLADEGFWSCESAPGAVLCSETEACSGWLWGRICTTKYKYYVWRESPPPPPPDCLSCHPSDWLDD
jgi:hypothetical protein